MDSNEDNGVGVQVESTSSSTPPDNPRPTSVETAIMNGEKSYPMGSDPSEIPKRMIAGLNRIAQLVESEFNEKLAGIVSRDQSLAQVVKLQNEVSVLKDKGKIKRLKDKLRRVKEQKSRLKTRCEKLKSQVDQYRQIYSTMSAPVLQALNALRDPFLLVEPEVVESDSASVSEDEQE